MDPQRPYPSLCQNLGLAVTVGSPFYGSAGQPHRYFVGEPLAGLTAQKAAIAKVIATFKCGFTLMFLDGGDLREIQGAALAADPKYPLPSYPSVDSNTT